MTKGKPPKRILFVEGQDDKHFVKNFCCKSSRERLICKFRDEENKCDEIVIDDGERKTGGLDNMLDRVIEEIKQPEIERLGIMADADNFDKSENSWNSIKTRLEQNLYLKNESIPDSPPKEGLILNNVASKDNRSSPFRLGVWLMPDNKTSGELENFFAKLINESDPAWMPAKQYINNYIKSIKKLNEQDSPLTKNPYKRIKAEVYAWLATRKKPGKIGAAISQGDGLNLESIAAQSFANWLENLFYRS